MNKGSTAMIEPTANRPKPLDSIFTTFRNQHPRCSFPLTCNKQSMRQHKMPMNKRCPMCVGRGTNARGSLCSQCNGSGEIPMPALIQPEAVAPGSPSLVERPARR
jgi:hypothetical protein